MTEFVIESLSGFPPFISHFALGLAMLGMFAAIYVKTTPYHEIHLIRDGNCAAAASLSGAMLGFVLPLAHAAAQSVNLLDMVIWGLIALIVQLSTYFVVRMVMPGISTGIPRGNTAQGIFLGAVSIATGVLNAACMAD